MCQNLSQLVSDGKTERHRSDGLLTDVPQRILSGKTKTNKLHTLLPWNWMPPGSLNTVTTGVA